MTLVQRLLGAALAALGVVLALGLAAWAWLARRSRRLPRRRLTIEGEHKPL